MVRYSSFWLSSRSSWLVCFCSLALLTALLVCLWLKMGMLSVTPSELFQFCLICSEKVKSLPLAFVLPMPAERLMLGM